MLAVNYRECRVLGRAFEGVAWQGLFFALTKLPEPPRQLRAPTPHLPARGSSRNGAARADVNHLAPGAGPSGKHWGTRASALGAVPARPVLQIAGFDSKTPDFRAGRAQLAPQ